MVPAGKTASKLLQLVCIYFVNIFLLIHTSNLQLTEYLEVLLWIFTFYLIYDWQVLFLYLCWWFKHLKEEKTMTIFFSGKRNKTNWNLIWAGYLIHFKFLRKWDAAGTDTSIGPQLHHCWCVAHTTKAPKETHSQTTVKSTRELDRSSWRLCVRDERANGIWSDTKFHWQRQYLIQHQAWQKKVKLSIIFNVWSIWEEGTDAN